MKTYLPAILSLIGLLSACQKEEPLEVCNDKCTIITGRLITATNQTPIGGAEIVVRWNYPAGSKYGRKVKTASTTDSDGKYTVSFFIKDNELAEGYFDVTYSVDENQYYTLGENTVAFYRGRIKRDTLIRVADYQIPRKAYVKLALTNPNQFVSDKGSLNSSFTTPYGFNTVFSRTLNMSGSDIGWGPAETLVTVAGDQPLLVGHRKWKNGIYTTTIDSLVIPAGTTHNITLTY